MRLRGRVDRNQTEIVRALRQIGASVCGISQLGCGVPDLLVGISGQNFLLEIKDPNQPPSKRRLTADEKEFHDLWRGQVCVVETVDEALAECAGGGAPRWEK